MRRALPGPGHHVILRSRPGSGRRERHRLPRVSAARPAGVRGPAPERGPFPGVGGSWRLLRAPGAQAGRLARARPPSSDKRGLWLPFRPGESCGSGASARGQRSCVAGAEMPGAPAASLPQPHFLPLASWHSQARACLDLSTPPLAGPDELPAFPLLSSPIPF